MTGSDCRCYVEATSSFVVPAQVVADWHASLTMSSGVTGDTACHVCGSTNFTSRYQVRDVNQGVPGQWTIIQCLDCGLGILFPLPPPSLVESFYQDGFYSSSEQARFHPLVEILRARLAHLRSKGLRRFYGAPGKLLDYGAGAGHFAAAMRDQGWEVSSVDVANQEHAHTQGRDIIEMAGDRPTLNYPEQSFDAVSLWYVIEHVLNPRETIKEIRRVLKPRGILLLAQQDFSSLQARVFGPSWLILDPPRHIYQFDERNLTRLCEELGFSLERVDRGSIEMGPYTILQSSLNCLLGNENYLFRALKRRDLRNASGVLSWGRKQQVLVWLSVALSVVLGPLSVLAYFTLLAFRQSDVFSAYYRLTDNASDGN